LKSVDDILKENNEKAEEEAPASTTMAAFVEPLSIGQFKLQGYDETFKAIQQLFYGILEDKKLSKKEKRARLKDVSGVHSNRL
jgi:hypothetical protein